MAEITQAIISARGEFAIAPWGSQFYFPPEALAALKVNTKAAYYCEFKKSKDGSIDASFVESGRKAGKGSGLIAFDRGRRGALEVQVLAARDTHPRAGVIVEYRRDTRSGRISVHVPSPEREEVKRTGLTDDSNSLVQVAFEWMQDTHRMELFAEYLRGRDRGGDLLQARLDQLYKEIY